MAAKGESSEPGSAFSTDPEQNSQLSVKRRKSELDEASSTVTSQERLRRLLSANRSIVQELSLPAVLRRIVDTARDLSGARYAALGVIGADGLLEEFLHEGLDEDAIRGIGGSMSEPC